MSLKVTIDRVKDVLASINTLTKHQVLVGIPDEKAERKPDPDEPHPLNNAEIGFLMETGVPERNIPARPFLVPGVKDNDEKIAKRYRAAAQKALDGDKAAVEKAHAAVGLETASAVRKKITDGPFAPLSEATLRARAARGRKGATRELKRRAEGGAADALNDDGALISNVNAKPLIDTGALRRSVTYVIRDGKK